MGTKIKGIIFLFCLILGLPVFANEFASRIADEVPVYKDLIVRVAIGDNQFKQYNYKEIPITATAEFFVYEKGSYEPIAKYLPNEVIKIKFNSGLFEIKSNSGKTLKNLDTTLIIDCPQGLIGVEGLKRKGKQAYYHGVFEISKKNLETFFVVNVIELQSYLKGVVPNEMPVRFGLEALKAQAVAARNYVLSPRAKMFKEFDVYDSVASQVYYGAMTEEYLSNKAVDETKGLVALYNWDLILAQYSSTAGGYTESYENAFSDPKTKEFPSKSKPYLKGKPDMLYLGSLESEEEAKNFYMSFPESYDVKSPYYRWQKEWVVNSEGKFELDEILPKTFKSQECTGFIKKEHNLSDFGKLQDIKIKRRGVSGKIMELEIITDRNTYNVQKELVIRRVFQKNNISLPSANVVFDIQKDKDGNLIKIVAFGGGFGHGVGMSQYGAGYMGSVLGRSFDQILKRYYTGISVSTIPVIISAHESQNVVTQAFYANKKKAFLIINNKFRVSKINMKINGVDVSFELDKNLLPLDNVFKIDISRYIRKGENVITFYYPSEEGNKKAIRLYVEVVGVNDDIIF